MTHTRRTALKLQDIVDSRVAAPKGFVMTDTTIDRQVRHRLKASKSGTSMWAILGLNQ